MATLAITVDDASVKGVLTRLSQRISDMRPIMAQIGQELRNDALENFQGQHAPDGTPWKGLSIATRIARARRVSGGSIYTKNGKSTKAKAYSAMMTAKALLDTGVLRASINVLETTSASVTVGSRLKYAAIHQFGGQAGRGKKVTIPARPFIGMSRGAERSIVDIINGHMNAN
jgi:phage gpG-like protein